MSLPYPCPKAILYRPLWFYSIQLLQREDPFLPTGSCFHEDGRRGVHPAFSLITWPKPDQPTLPNHMIGSIMGTWLKPGQSEDFLPPALGLLNWPELPMSILPVTCRKPGWEMERVVKTQCYHFSFWMQPCLKAVTSINQKISILLSSSISTLDFIPVNCD